MKPGDIVRYLNAVGGGRVVRIDGNMAIVDDEGFETPVLVRECVVVAEAGSRPSTTSFKEVKSEPAPKAPKAPAPKAEPEPEIVIPAPETAAGERLNIALAFDPLNIKQMSTTTFDAVLVNDSNYYLLYTFMGRKDDEADWTLLHSGMVEPGIQVAMVEITREMIPGLDHVAVQYVAFKRDKAFAAKHPAMVEVKVDTTKFFKLHCFKPSTYFDTPVLQFDITVDDAPVMRAKRPDTANLEKALNSKKNADLRPRQRVVKRRQPAPADVDPKAPLEVDLHIDQLVDTTAGLSNADILNLQIDTFCRVMDDNLKRHGRRIVFIHGKGEGVLRQALMKELTHRYKGHDVQDASFREYGFGATQVTIK